MSASSVATYNRWRDLMRSWGFTVLEAAGCDTQSASSRAVDPSGMFVEHHDASSILSGNWGSLATILAGRPGIPPRLSNLQFARDGQAMIVCKNVANHGGFGGPLLGVPANDVNVHSCGAEVANNGLGEPYSPALTRSIIHGEAAWAIVTGRTEKFIRGHKEWAPGRKSDPVLNMDDRRAAVAAVISNGGPIKPTTTEQEDDDMIRLIATDRDDRVLCVDHGAHTYWRVAGPAQLSWLKRQGIQQLDGKQPFALIADYRDLGAAAAQPVN